MQGLRDLYRWVQRLYELCIGVQAGFSLGYMGVMQLVRKESTWLGILARSDKLQGEYRSLMVVFWLGAY